MIAQAKIERKPRAVFLLLMAALMILAACNMPGQVTEEPSSPTLQETEPPTEEPTPDTAPTEEEPAPTELEIPTDAYTIAVIVDLTSDPVTRQQAQAVIDEASAIFQGRTGFSIVMVDFVEIMPEQAERRSDLPDRYLASNPAVIPNGIVLFSYGDNNQAQLYGGYSGAMHGPSSYHSHFPINGDDTLINVSTVHFGHRYAICGYDPEDDDNLISEVSLGGQCRNQPGTPCEEKYGYSMCSTAIDDLYASTPTYMVSSSIVHEIAHPFGRHGTQDHYGTQECQQEMGWNSSSWHFALEDAQEWVGMCPYVYDLIVESYQP